MPGLLYGLALLAKASALVFGPLCMAVIELDRLASNGALERAIAEARTGAGAVHQAASLFGGLRELSISFRHGLGQIVAIGFVVMMAYGSR